MYTVNCKNRLRCEQNNRIHSIAWSKKKQISFHILGFHLSLCSSLFKHKKILRKQSIRIHCDFWPWHIYEESVFDSLCFWYCDHFLHLSHTHTHSRLSRIPISVLFSVVSFHSLSWNICSAVNAQQQQRWKITPNSLKSVWISVGIDFRYGQTVKKRSYLVHLTPQMYVEVSSHNESLSIAILVNLKCFCSLICVYRQ